MYISNSHIISPSRHAPAPSTDIHPQPFRRVVSVLLLQVMLSVLGCRLTYQGQAETNAWAWFNIALRPRKPEGSLGRPAQDGHLDSLSHSSWTMAASVFVELLNYLSLEDKRFHEQSMTAEKSEPFIRSLWHACLVQHVQKRSKNNKQKKIKKNKALFWNASFTGKDSSHSNPPPPPDTLTLMHALPPPPPPDSPPPPTHTHLVTVNNNRCDSGSSSSIQNAEKRFVLFKLLSLPSSTCATVYEDSDWNWPSF